MRFFLLCAKSETDETFHLVFGVGGWKTQIVVVW